MYENKSILFFVVLLIVVREQIHICCGVPPNLASCVSVTPVKKGCGALLKNVRQRKLNTNFHSIFLLARPEIDCY